MEQKGRGNVPFREDDFQKETKQIPRFVLRGQRGQHSENVLVHSERVLQQNIPRPPTRVETKREGLQPLGKGVSERKECFRKIQRSEKSEDERGRVEGSSEKLKTGSDSGVNEPIYATALRIRESEVKSRINFEPENKYESDAASPRLRTKTGIISKPITPSEPKYAQSRKLTSAFPSARTSPVPASILKQHTLPLSSKVLCSEASKYSFGSQVPKLQKFPVSPSDRISTPPLDPPVKGIFPSQLSTELAEGGNQVESKTSHVMTKVSDEQRSDSSKNSKVSKWMSSWLQFRHRRKAHAEHGPAIDRGGLDVTPSCSEAFTHQIGPRERFNERRERSRVLQNRGKSADSRGERPSMSGEPSPAPESPKHIFSWRSTSGPIPPRLEVQTPPLRTPRLPTPPEPTPNPWLGKKVEIGLLEPRALSALHSVSDQDRLSATLGKIFKASPHLRNALAHHFGVLHEFPKVGPVGANEAVVLAVGIDLYIEEVFQQLDPEGHGFVSAEDFLLLCEILSLPKSLPSTSKNLNLEQFRSQLFEHFVASFEETSRSGQSDVLKAQVTVSRRAGILDKISQNIDKLLSTLELEEAECDCSEAQFKQSFCARCKRGRAGSSTPESARTRIRELQVKVLSQQKEIHALREVVEDMRMALQSSDAENLALKVRLKKQQKMEGKKGIDRLVEELREIGQTGTSAPHNSFQSETSSIDDELQTAMQALQIARADLQSTQEELNQTAMRLMQKEREIELNRETFSELRGTLEAAQMEIRRLQMELQESQTALLFTQAELDGTSAELRAAKREIRQRDLQLRNMSEKLVESANSRDRLLEELQRTRDLLAQCLSRVKQLELLHSISADDHHADVGSAEALSDEADGNEPPKTDDSGLYSPVVSDKDEQEGEPRSRSRSRDALSEDDLWPTRDIEFDGSTNETLSTVREMQQEGIVRSLQQQIGTLQKQLQDVQADWEEERSDLISRLSMSDGDKVALAKSLREAEYEADRLRAIEDKLRSVLRSMATLHTMSLSRRSVGRILIDAVERSIDPLTNECNLFKFLATLQQSSSEMERLGTESLINLALAAV